MFTFERVGGQKNDSVTMLVSNAIYVSSLQNAWRQNRPPTPFICTASPTNAPNRLLYYLFLLIFLTFRYSSVKRGKEGRRISSKREEDQPGSIRARTRPLRFRRNRRRIESFRIRCPESWNGAQIQRVNDEYTNRTCVKFLRPHLARGVEKKPPSCISRQALTRTAWASSEPASPTLHCSCRPSPSGSESAPPCSSSSTGWCCSRTPSCRRAARSARCRTR